MTQIRHSLTGSDRHLTDNGQADLVVVVVVVVVVVIVVQHAYPSASLDSKSIKKEIKSRKWR